MLTQQEKELVDGLGEMWDKFMELPVDHSMDRQEFCTKIHELQNMVLARSGRREINGD